MHCATAAGARSLHVETGTLVAGKLADFFTVDLNDPAVAGSSPDELLNVLVLSASPRAIVDVVVSGQSVIAERQHKRAPEILEAFSRVQRRLNGER